MSDLTISAVRIFVPDVAEAVPFYRDILDLAPRAIDPDGGFAVFDAGIMLVIEPVPLGSELAGRFSGASFEVDDMQIAYAGLAQRGVTFDGPPQREDWGGFLAHFKDPAGNTLTLVEYPKT